MGSQDAAQHSEVGDTGHARGLVRLVCNAATADGLAGLGKAPGLHQERTPRHVKTLSAQCIKVAGGPRPVFQKLLWEGRESLSQTAKGSNSGGCRCVKQGSMVVEVKSGTRLDYSKRMKGTGGGDVGPGVGGATRGTHRGNRGLEKKFPLSITS